MIAVARRWGAALIIVAAIFALSSQPSAVLPYFGWADLILKKGGHVLGYGLLALALWRGFEWSPHRPGTSALLSIMYGATDELHHRFVPGRQASLTDLFVFDALGVVLALWLYRRFSAHRSDPTRV